MCRGIILGMVRNLIVIFIFRYCILRCKVMPMKQKIQAVVEKDWGPPTLKLTIGEFVVNMPTDVASEIATAIFDAIRVSPSVDVDKIATGISSKDRSSIDRVREFIRDHGQDGVTEEEVVKHCEKLGIADVQARRAIKTLDDACEIYKIGNLYKRC